jgi:hypothetical protein
MQMLHHPNIVALRDSFYSQDSSAKVGVWEWCSWKEKGGEKKKTWRLLKRLDDNNNNNVHVNAICSFEKTITLNLCVMKAIFMNWPTVFSST